MTFKEVLAHVIDCHKQTVASFEGARRRERFGQVTLPAVRSRFSLVWCHAELGTFAEGSALGDEGLRIAEAAAHPGSLMFASLGGGLLSLRQGDLRRALPLLFVMEDLHWVDPSTLELLSLLVDQGPTTRILVLLTFRLDFSPPWTGRSHLTQVTLHRLRHRQVAEMTGQVAHNKALPPEVVEQVVAKTDGVPLFVEELTKMVLESGLLQEREDGYELTGPLPSLAIPTTLHDSLMARLDRLATVKALAQLGATLGREFSYDLLQAVSPWDEATLRRGLQQLVEAEFLYQQGLPPQATYLFKHALIQEAAYQSLLRSTRQHHHQCIAQVLEEHFPETCETQPELLAHHYTEAGLMAPAVRYWQRAGQCAIERSANVEAIGHLSKGLQVLSTLPATAERIQPELQMQLTLGPALMAARGYGAVEVGHTYARAHELCQHGGDPQQHFQALWGLWRFHVVGQAVIQARPLADQLLALAQQAHDTAFLLEAHNAAGITLFYLGEFTPALTHLEAAMALYDPEQHRALAFRYGQDPGVICYAFAALTLWMLGYPDQSLQHSQAALAHAQDPFSRAYALFWTALPPQFCGRRHTVYDQAETAIALSTEQRFPLWKEGCHDTARLGPGAPGTRGGRTCPDQPRSHELACDRSKEATSVFASLTWGNLQTHRASARGPHRACRGAC